MSIPFIHARVHISHTHTTQKERDARLQEVGQQLQKLIASPPSPNGIIYVSEDDVEISVFTLPDGLDTSVRTESQEPSPSKIEPEDNPQDLRILDKNSAPIMVGDTVYAHDDVTQELNLRDQGAVVITLLPYSDGKTGKVCIRYGDDLESFSQFWVESYYLSHHQYG